MHASGRMRIAKRYFAARTPLSILFAAVYDKAKGMLIRTAGLLQSSGSDESTCARCRTSYVLCDECSLSFSMQG